MVSLLIPTMNRSDFVLRLLKYYERLNVPFHFLIGDSSEPQQYEKTRRAVESLKGRLQVRQFPYPGLNNYAVTQELVKNVTTPYSSFLPDDDFFVPRSLLRCKDFLDQNPDYICAWGKAIVFRLKEQGPYGTFAALGSSNETMNHSLEDDDVRKRMLEHVRYYSASYVAVTRTSHFARAMRLAQDLHRTARGKDDTWWTATQFGELAASFSLAAQGKLKFFDCVYWIRQVHDQRYLFPNGIHWLATANWPACYEVVSRQIIEDLKETQGLPAEKAEAVWHQVFSKYLSEGLFEEYQDRYVRAASRESRLKEKIKGIPVLHQCLQRCREMTRRARANYAPDDSVNLQSVLRPSSPYYQDFQPVYELVTQGGKETAGPTVQFKDLEEIPTGPLGRGPVGINSRRLT